MLKLMVEREVTGSVVPIRWCIEKDSLNEFKAKMAQESVKNPYLLLVIVAGFSIEHILAPFDQMVEHVQLRHPGENTIFATIVWSSGGYKQLWKRFLKKDGYGYSRYNTDTVIISYDGKKRSFSPPSWHIGEAELVVKVPAEMFAKEPPAWEKRWVNFWFETKAKDECQYRRRRILAYTAQPPAVLFWLFLKLGARWLSAIFLLALGLWTDFGFDDRSSSINWNPKNWSPMLKVGPLFHPWEYDYLDLFTSEFKDAFGSTGPFILLLSVYFIVPFSALKIALRILGKLFSKIWKLMPDELLEKAAGGIGSVFMKSLSALSALISKIPWPSFPENKWGTSKTAAETTKGKRPIAAPMDIYQLLSCENASSIKPREVVPFRHKVHLYYNDLKMKVCKPFAN